MHYLKSVLPFILVATTLASADTTTSADSKMSTTCASEDVLQQCIQSMQSHLENCAPDDWNCQCTSSKDMVYCYNNCPDGSSKKDAESIRQQYCANAKAYAPTSTAALAISSSLSSSSTVSTTTRAATMSTDIDDGTDISDSEAENDSEEHPTKLYSGLEANAILRPEQGTASGLRIRGWLGLGLALGALLSSGVF
ncbi:hypothetical protein N7517_009172 [Penicillium concentricum]|uniref:GPI anchored serine-threonine rich protein n=1 Tax=Penicillium concentricum TaxID=293559 RepID=A0A9W9UYX7_9EURO|nr:uncharacterized protein N7517_009172 [Penicillium concentricum]KAJ5359981.1 hypothetical protein N7517_009172 [Penicillium concentricum]